VPGLSFVKLRVLRGNRFHRKSRLAPPIPGPKWESALHSQQIASPLFSTMWKTRPQPRTKPVIARDTTYGVSLLTGTIGGSNFAIPRHEFRFTGMRRNRQSSARAVKVERLGPGQRWLGRHRKATGARASWSVSPAPATLGESWVPPDLSRAEQRKPEAKNWVLDVRWPCPRPSPGHDKNCK